MVSLARKNLLEDFSRFLVAQLGITFAVSLVTIQTGLLEGFGRSATLLVNKSQADFWIASSELRYFGLTLPIEYQVVLDAQAVAGVVAAEPLLIQSAMWRRSETEAIDPVQVVGIEPTGTLLPLTTVAGATLTELEEPYSVIVDRIDLNALSLTALGEQGRVNNYPATVTGWTRGVKSIVSSPYVFTSLETANLYLNFPRFDTSEPVPEFLPLVSPSTRITYVMVKANPAEDLAKVQERLRAAFPNYQVLSRAALSEMTRRYWLASTSVGFILGLGAGVGIVVGIVIVSQILYSSVSDRLQEYGTLKAMGASDGYLYRIIIEQALWMAVLGYLPGLGLCWGLGMWTMQARAIQIIITPQLALAVFSATVAMCVSASLLAIQKVMHLDPAQVFRA
ncbi:FtsX-like permease family protein [Thermosynechococcus sp. QKsg1]|uniref:FtsX-like permease family protein n=1 Tax=unclassified Thermosynechococcus TaxID=2622553 RepID=UPI00122E2C25|nr:MULTISPECIES: FtsX-like permease family protein [unclassified Thermosynechococcus]QEQ01965.1 FtsX-like permease family protein [Thermosynechococcus sp. CL-1]WNC86483.1 FtsX-like permease family protein [Thermosynechococcus sp. QKsg1]